MKFYLKRFQNYEPRVVTLTVINLGLPLGILIQTLKNKINIERLYYNEHGY